jgi:polyhydroxyalkanoate synthesis regulator phasin
VNAALLTSLASVLVAVIAAGAAIASQRAAAAASVKNASTASRTQLEQEAYQRAENFLTGTMDRQDSEIQELRGEVDELRTKVRSLEHDLALSEEHVRTLSRALAAHGES